MKLADSSRFKWTGGSSVRTLKKNISLHLMFRLELSLR